MITKFKIFEAVIQTINFEEYWIIVKEEIFGKSLNATEIKDKLNEIFSEKDVEFRTYDEFLIKLPSTVDKKTVPPRHANTTTMGIKFGFYDDTYKKCVIIINENELCLCFSNDNYFNKFKSMSEQILRHEYIHLKQVQKDKRIDYILPDVRNMKEYLTNQKEMMAWSRSIADEIKNRPNLKDILSSKSKLTISPSFCKYINYCDDLKIWKKLTKYIYQYLEQDGKL